jgi:hypothetical protein
MRCVVIQSTGTLPQYRGTCTGTSSYVRNYYGHSSMNHGLFIVLCSPSWVEEIMRCCLPHLQKKLYKNARGTTFFLSFSVSGPQRAPVAMFIWSVYTPHMLTREDTNCPHRTSLRRGKNPHP